MSLIPRLPTGRELLRLGLVLVAVAVYVAIAHGILSVIPAAVGTPVVLALILGPFAAFVALRTFRPEGARKRGRSKRTPPPPGE